jgi:hypothetical protein
MKRVMKHEITAKKSLEIGAFVLEKFAKYLKPENNITVRVLSKFFIVLSLVFVSYDY